MSVPDPFGAGGPFGSGPLGDLMRNLARFFTTQGPLNWEIARQMAQWTATGGQPEQNPDPVSRVRLEELIRVAEMHVAEATGLQVSSGGVLKVLTVTPSDWALRTLEAWKPFLEKLASRMTGTLQGGEQTGTVFGFGGLGSTPGEGAGEETDPMSRLFETLPNVLGPFLFGLQAGSMVGQLANRAMGQYDLPMPRPAGDDLLFVAATIDRFADDWSLGRDDASMWICLREATNHAVLGRPHVRERLDELITAYVEAFEPNPRALEERLGTVDPTDMAALQEAFGNPETLVGEMQNDAQRQIQVSLQALLAAVVGYVDHVMDTVGRRLIGSYGPLTEALRRRRLEESPGTRILGQLCGVVLDAGGYERGQAFVRGVLERAGEDGLARLWRSARELPTPAELTAPGLWLARIDLPEEAEKPEDPEGKKDQ
jgi:putative hydrolase